MTRQVVLDTETTGLEPEQGHRIVEIGGVELVDRRFTERRFHRYVDPARDIEPGALEVHGLTAEFLSDKPRFAEIAREFLDFVSGAEVVIHNAPFDVAFIDSELARLAPSLGKIADHCTIVDSLALARSTHPGQRNSLDALCSRYQVDNSQRVLHGALLDAEILADVYLAMTGGQASFELDAFAETTAERGDWRLDPERPRVRVLRAEASELAKHEARLVGIQTASGGRCLWIGQSPPP